MSLFQSTLGLQLGWGKLATAGPQSKTLARRRMSLQNSNTHRGHEPKRSERGHPCPRFSFVCKKSRGHGCPRSSFLRKTLVLLHWIACCVALASGAGALEWRSDGGYRRASVGPFVSNGPGFTLMPATETGVAFTNVIHESTYFTNQIYLNGSGVAAGDVNGDGLCDLYFCGLEGANALYLNRGGWRFEESAERAGIACPGLMCTGAAFADIDGDGDLDLIVNTVGQGTFVFVNDGSGKFGLNNPPLNVGRGGVSLALADIDGDGDLDLYVVNYRTTTLRDMPNTRFRGKKVDGIMKLETVNGRPVSDPDLEGRFTLDPQGRVEEHGEPSVLFMNDGTGRFTPESFVGGRFLDEDGRALVKPPYDWGLSALFRDLNGDGAPDLYVCNDFSSPDRIWINDGHGRFQAIALLAIRHTSQFSMGVDVADVDRDGFDDIFVTEMRGVTRLSRQTGVIYQPVRPPLPGEFRDRPQVPHLNTFFKNRGDGTYAEIACFAGVQASGWSWTAMFLDVDLDGFEDLLITTGHEREMNNVDVSDSIEKQRRLGALSPQELLATKSRYPRLALPNVAFRNLGGFKFEEAGKAWGFDRNSVSQGMAAADLDNDGDLDLVINNLNEDAFLMRNNSGGPRVAVRLKGRAPNTRGVGARIELEGGPVRQSQEMICGGRYGSADDSMRVFAAGSTNASCRLVVKWRGGGASFVEAVRANGIYEIYEASSEPVLQQPVPSPVGPRFVDASPRLAHRHQDRFFDDLARQPLLPRCLSQLGPGVVCVDLNGDGHKDLMIGGGSEGALAAFAGDGKGGFRRLDWSLMKLPDCSEQTGLLALQTANRDVFVVVGHSYYESPGRPGPILSVMHPLDGSVATNFPVNPSGTRALAAADYNLDRETDFFAGGGCIPGRYPEAGPSYVFQNHKGQWSVDESNVAALKDVGLVNGACWSDLDKDGFPELILACEWGPLRIFKNDRGILREATKEWGFESATGWWRAVATGDFDGDGSPDIMAANWGLNSYHRPNVAHPERLYYILNDSQEVFDLLEASYDEGFGGYVPERSFRFVLGAMPFIQDVASTHDAYARSGVEKLLGARARTSRHREASTFASVIFLNRLSSTRAGGRAFVMRELPAEAQFAPANAICLADFDKDGHLDAVLSQNFFGTHADMVRQDGGRGLLLRGDGRGGFAAVPGKESGIVLYGEQRGAVAGDFDEDGFDDLVVAQNAGTTVLFMNTGRR